MAENLTVLVDYLPLNSTHSPAVCTLKVPNKLLRKWQLHDYHTKCDADVINELNRCIEDGVLAVKCTCHTLANRLRQAICKIKYRQHSCRGGRKLDQLMNGEYITYLLKSDMESFVKIKDKLLEVQEASQSWRTIAMEKEKEVSELLEAMAGDYSAFIDEIEMKDLELKRNTGMRENRGRMIHEVGHKQAKRQLQAVTDRTKVALSFAKTFGLMPQKVIMTKITGEKVTIDCAQNATSLADQNDDREKVAKILYLLDRFSISDQAYHEVAQFSNALPRLYQVKQRRHEINSTLTIERLHGDVPGAYRPFKMFLQEKITHAIEDNPGLFSTTMPIKVKLSGDGAPFSRTSTFILLSFSLPEMKNALSESGTHTIAIIRGSESYETLALGLKQVFDEINEMINSRPKCTLSINQMEYTLEFYLGGDYKFLLLLMGLNEAISIYSCLWCKIKNNKRWDMTVPLCDWTVNESRSLEEIIAGAKLPKSSSPSARLGVKDSPLLLIPTSKIIPDELHILLRITDVLTRNVILHAVEQDIQARQLKQSDHFLSTLEACVHECGITFKVWQKKDGSGKYEFTSLRGGDKKKLLSLLPDKFNRFLGDDYSKVAKLWKDFEIIYNIISSKNPSITPDEIHKMGKQWVNTFLSLGEHDCYQQSNVTPYMHILVYHVPYFIDKYGNMKQFSGQGVEKNNDLARRHFRQSNKWDSACEMLRTEGREYELRSLEREKRKYEKVDSVYWKSGIVESRSKRAKIGN